MQLDLTKDDVENILAALEVQHQKFMKEGESRGYDLEGDIDRYMDIRQKELALAHTINRIKRQRTAQANRPNPNPAKAEEPLADWEVELLLGDRRNLTVTPDDPRYGCTISDILVLDEKAYAIIGVSTGSEGRTFALKRRID